MLGPATSFREWSSHVQHVVAHQLDRLLYSLGAMDAPSRLIVSLAMILLCYFVLDGFRSKSAY